MNEDSKICLLLPQYPDILPKSTRWENQTVIASQGDRVVICGCEGRGEEELSGVKVRIHFHRDLGYVGQYAHAMVC